jgi:hypothetical protein
LPLCSLDNAGRFRHSALVFVVPEAATIALVAVVLMVPVHRGRAQAFWACPVSNDVLGGSGLGFRD